MKCHHRFAKLERHRLAAFVIYIDFDRVEFATSYRHVMRSLVDVSHDFSVSSGDIADAKQGGFCVADDDVRRHVTIDLHEIQPAVRVEGGSRNEIGILRRYQFLFETEKFE